MTLKNVYVKCTNLLPPNFFAAYFIYLNLIRRQFLIWVIKTVNDLKCNFREEIFNFDFEAKFMMAQTRKKYDKHTKWATRFLASWASKKLHVLNIKHGSSHQNRNSQFFCSSSRNNLQHVRYWCIFLVNEGRIIFTADCAEQRTKTFSP